MDSATYMASRVEDQITWMEGKSKWNQTRYKTIKVIEIIAAALVPLLAGYQTDVKDTRSTLGIIIGSLGILIVILTSLRQLYKYQENWLTYRTTLEALKREKFLFETGAMPYNDNLAFQKFVINVESLLAKENESWKAVWSANGNPSKQMPLNTTTNIADSSDALKDIKTTDAEKKPVTP